MGRHLSTALAFVVLTAANPAMGTESIDPAWLVDAARVPAQPAEPDLIRLEMHGELQGRFRAQSPIRLPLYRAESSEFDQTTRLTHWLRITPELQLGDSWRIVGQADIARGFIAGRLTQHVESAQVPYEEHHPLRADPRWLYIEHSVALYSITLGQQPSHWGLGLVDNDGDHPVRWGDYQGGTRVERLEMRLHPKGSESPIPFELRFAGDIVFADAQADVRDDEVAARAVGSLRLGEARGDNLGAMVLYRRQSQPSPVETNDRAITRQLTLDATGQFVEPIPGLPAWLFGRFEVAAHIGESELMPTIASTSSEESQSIASYGGVAEFGVVITKEDPDPRSTRSHYGRVALELEWGWASGDADPYDGTHRRFAFDPNHNVGLILFDEVLAWKTARSAVVGRDPELGPRPRPEAEALVTNGAVAGATYLFPQIAYRPHPKVDLLAALLVAQTTADLVDPVAVFTTGSYQNFDGGDPTSHDLGTELMIGAEWRSLNESGIAFQLGAQAATLFPGNAFADASRGRMKALHAAQLRLGVQF